MRLVPTDKPSIRMLNLRTCHARIRSCSASSGYAGDIATQHQKFGHLEEFIGGVFWCRDNFSAFQVK